eukprot:1048196-Pelagomonas_calceolata.AAC.1
MSQQHQSVDEDAHPKLQAQAHNHARELGHLVQGIKGCARGAGLWGFAIHCRGLGLWGTLQPCDSTHSACAYRGRLAFRRACAVGVSLHLQVRSAVAAPKCPQLVRASC